MNLLHKLFGRFTSRGRALIQLNKGRESAATRDFNDAVVHYTELVKDPNAPRDIIAMALFNRALACSATHQDKDAERDLVEVLEMREDFPKIKKFAREKLLRIRKRSERNSENNDKK